MAGSANDSANDPEPFPDLEETSGREPSPYIAPAHHADQSRNRGVSTASTVGERLRRLSRDFEESAVPGGFMAATGTLAADILSLSEQQRVYNRENDPWSSRELTSRGKETDDKNGRRASRVGADTATDSRKVGERAAAQPSAEGPSADAIEVENYAQELQETEPFDNGYHFPPSYGVLDSTKHLFISLWHYFVTPLGFFVVIYGLNVVAWGGMLFLLLCNASPAMCNGDCNDINSPRRIWVEVDSQILNALFCVTGFGLIPWRFRDLYYLLVFRIGRKEEGLRRLAGINRGWYRLPGSQDLPIGVGPDNITAPQGPEVPIDSIPYPVTRIPDSPRTGTRAPATKTWKLDFVIWAMAWNTFLQAVLCGFMWGMNRYNRPSWATGLFVGLACMVAAAGGLMMFIEGKKVKGIEGVPVTERDLNKLEHDRQMGIPHYNNIDDKKPKMKKEDTEATMKSSTSKRRSLKLLGKQSTQTSDKRPES